MNIYNFQAEQSLNYTESTRPRGGRRVVTAHDELDPCGDTSCDSLDLDLELDSVSQLSVASSHVAQGDMFKCVSSDNIHNILSSNRSSVFNSNYLRYFNVKYSFTKLTTSSIAYVNFFQ